MRLRGGVLVLTVIFFLPQDVWAWGARVHRMLLDAALDGLPADGPTWLREPATRARLDFMVNQPDRWRGWTSTQLKHWNDQDHYLDAEDLEQFGLTLETVPHLRREYLRALAVAKHVHPENVAAYDAAKDPARTKEWPGFVLHGIAEEYGKLQASFNQVRILEQARKAGHEEDLAAARALVLVNIGTLAHFVCDVAQPLHTTRHFDGWVGENPAGYKWREKFHSYIDSGLADRHHVEKADVLAVAKFDRKVNADDPWDDVVKYFAASHAQLEKLYALERDGQLDGPAGKELLLGRFADASALLEALIQAAYASAAPTAKQSESWFFFEGGEKKAATTTSAPTSQPAGGMGS